MLPRCRVGLLFKTAMCGLAGIFDTTGKRSVDRELLRRMTDALTHRGPDGSGLHVEPGLGLGHRRLSIIDIEQGAQPMVEPDSGVVVSFNGEIYNFPALIEQLSAKGYRFQTRCDTEVILHAWREWGPDCLDHFDGMFAFALWDPREETLFLARDRFGKKPLYYATLGNGLLIFGSELKALMHHPDLPRDIDPQAVEDYFSLGYIPDPKSIYKAVRKLPAGQCILWQRGSTPKHRTYWVIPLTGGSEAGRPDDLVARLRDATAERLISDVPLGAFLSGGVDSGSVVSQMAGLISSPVKTFTIGYDDAEEDESDLAQIVAKRYGTDHTLKKVDPDDFDLVTHLAAIYDEPFGDSSAMPTFRVSELARQSVTVALSGDGGDELLAGYARYHGYLRLRQVRNRFPDWLHKPLFGTIAALYPKADWAPRRLRGKSSFQQLALSDLEAHFHTVSAMSSDIKQRIYAGDFYRTLGGYRGIEAQRPHWDRAKDADLLTRMQYTDIKTWLPSDILTKVDRASMANSLEVRSPLLDHRLGAWALNLPPSSKLQNGVGKAALKKAMEPYLPNDLLYRTKQGFAPPLDNWMRHGAKDFVHDALTSDRLLNSGFIDAQEVSNLVNMHQSGRRKLGRELWLLLMFHGFLEHDATYGRAS